MLIINLFHKTFSIEGLKKDSNLTKNCKAKSSFSTHPFYPILIPTHNIHNKKILYRGPKNLFFKFNNI